MLGLVVNDAGFNFYLLPDGWEILYADFLLEHFASALIGNLTKMINKISLDFLKNLMGAIPSLKFS
jgi:hypothetical protein